MRKIIACTNNCFINSTLQTLHTFLDNSPFNNDKELFNQLLSKTESFTYHQAYTSKYLRKKTVLNKSKSSANMQAESHSFKRSSSIWSISYNFKLKKHGTQRIRQSYRMWHETECNRQCFKSYRNKV